MVDVLDEELIGGASLPVARAGPQYQEKSTDFIHIA